MAEVKTTLVYEGKEYVASVKTIESIDIRLDREIFISMAVHFNDVSFGGFVLGHRDKDSTETGIRTKYLYDWVHAVFQLTGVENFKYANGKPVLVIWKNTGGLGDRAIGLATVDGSFVFIPREGE